MKNKTNAGAASAKRDAAIDAADAKYEAACAPHRAEFDATLAALDA